MRDWGGGKKRTRELTKVSALFDIYKEKLRAPQQTVVDAVVEVIADVTGMKIDGARCVYTVSTRTLATNAPAVVRQEIKMHHAEIVVHLQGRLGVASAPLCIL